MAVDPILATISRAFGAIPGSPTWEAAVRAITQEFFNIPEGSGPRAVAKRAASDWLLQQSNADPSSFNAIMVSMGLQAGVQGDQTTQQDIVNFLSGNNGNGLFTDTISNVTQNIERTRNEIINITSQADQIVNQTTTIFVDVPTPEEVLDDFRTAAVTYADTLFRAGDIDQRTRNFMLSRPNLLLNSYLAALGAKADAGENIFKVVGLDFGLIPIEQIGERIGPTFQEEVRETIETIEKGELTIEELTKRVQNDLLSGANTDSQKENITETINEIFKQHGTIKTTEETVSNLLQLTTENIFQRPNLTTVFAFSPLDFLRQQFTPQSLTTLAGITPGREQFEQQFASGVAPSAPRQLA